MDHFVARELVDRTVASPEIRKDNIGVEEKI